jgi:arylsulfatase
MKAMKPNILVIWGDDIGQSRTSAPTRDDGLPHAQHRPHRSREGASSSPTTTAEQSCTAGRAAFITGQSPIRTGLTKVGLPGAPGGPARRRTRRSRTLLKAQGYATGQFGKNHLGDRDEFLPTAHGFDEFFGNLYHLNAEEEPENDRLSEGLPDVQEEVRAARRDPQLRADGRRSRTPAR